VRSLFPDEPSEPALGAFFTEAPRDTPATALPSLPFDSGPVTGAAPQAAPFPAGRSPSKADAAVPLTLIVGITALCAVASLLFWLAVSR
jgi:hypothetical protein